MKLTDAKIDRIQRACEGVLDCDELQRSYQESPLAHEARAEVYAALRTCATLRALKNGRPS